MMMQILPVLKNVAMNQVVVWIPKLVRHLKVAPENHVVNLKNLKTTNEKINFHDGMFCSHAGSGAGNPGDPGGQWPYLQHVQ